MDIEELEARITEANNEMVSAEEVEEVVESPQPTDLWQQRRKAQRDNTGPVVRGSRPKS